MKIRKTRLREIIKGVVLEAAEAGRLQKIYRLSFSNMIKKASTGGNKNTAPFTHRAPKVGKSAPPGD